MIAMKIKSLTPPSSPVGDKTFRECVLNDIAESHENNNLEYLQSLTDEEIIEVCATSCAEVADTLQMRWDNETVEFHPDLMLYIDSMIKRADPLSTEDILYELEEFVVGILLYVISYIKPSICDSLDLDSYPSENPLFEDVRESAMNVVLGDGLSSGLMQSVVSSLFFYYGRSIEDDLDIFDRFDESDLMTPTKNEYGHISRSLSPQTQAFMFLPRDLSRGPSMESYISNFAPHLQDIIRERRIV